MKKVIVFASALILLFANAAMADSIAGKFGIGLKGGASYVFNSELADIALGGSAKKEITTDLGYGVGGGVIYGINDNLAVNFDVIYTQADLKLTEYGGYTYDEGRGKTVDFALGAQWRFIPKSQFVPYVEAGLDVLWNQMDITGGGIDEDVAATYGAHLSAGGDFFFNPHVALNAEIRGLYSTEGDIKNKIGNTTVWAHYNPSNVSAFLGLKFFFP